MADDLAAVVNFVTELVRRKGSVVGAQIGMELARSFPQFDRRSLGYPSLTSFLDRAAPQLSIAGQSGTDFIWSTEADAGHLGGYEEDDQSSGSERDAFQDAHLKQFTARHFKSLNDVQIELRKFNVLVGANGSGKTNILEGLFRLSQLRFKKPATIFSGRQTLRDLATQGAEGKVKLRIDADTEGAVFLEYEGVPLPDEPAIHTVRVKYGEETVVYEYSLGPVDGPPLRDSPILRAFGGTILLRLDAYQLARPHISTSVLPRLQYNGRGLPSVLADLAATDPERLDRIFRATREIVPAFERARMPKQEVFYRKQGEKTSGFGHRLELQLHGRWLDAGLASEGTLLVLGLMTIVHGLTSTRLLLMDDIDRALHPRAQRSLVKQLAELTDEGLQLVCTTHSPILLDAVDPEDVIVVRASPQNGFTRAKRLVEHQAWAKWRDSMTAGEFWSYVGEDWLEADGATP